MSAFTRSAWIALLLTVSMPAAAQRVSQAERIAALEQRVAGSQSNADLLNQIAQLRSETQALRAQIEELQQSRDAAVAAVKSQALDVDSRLGRLEGAAAPRVVSTDASAVSTRATAAKPAASTGPTYARPTPRAASTSPRAGGPALSPGDAPNASAAPAGAELAAYTTAFDALKSARYAEASALFAAYIDRYPGSVYAPNALYWLGESYYATRAYTQALEPFRQLVDRFPTHDKAAGAWLKIGLAELNLKHGPQARAAFAEVVSRYPGTDAARSAADRLQALQPAP